MSSLGAPLVPTIAHTYGVSLSTAQWVLTAALLTGALATPVMGRLADGARQRDVIVVTLGVVLARLHPVGGGRPRSWCWSSAGPSRDVGLGLLPVNMAIARRNLEPVPAGRAIATLSVSTAIGAGLGYPLTAMVAQLLDLHAAYWFGAIVVAGALACSIAGPPSEDPGRTPLVRHLGCRPAQPGRHRRFGGAERRRELGVDLDPSPSGSSWPRCVVLVVWVPHELRSAHPLVNLHHLANRSVLMADVAGFLMCVSMYLVVPIVVEFIQIPPSYGFGFGASVMVSGLVLVPLSVGTFLASRLLVPYERRFGVRSMIPLGALVFAGASAYFALDHGSLWQAFVTMGIVGLGIGFTFAAMPGFIIRAVPAAETGSATGFYQVLRNIGLSVGSAFGAAVLLAYTKPGATFPDVNGFRVALLISAGLGLLTAVLAFVLPGSGEPNGPRRPPGAVHDPVETRMEEEALLEAAGAMLVDESDLEPGGRRP